MNLRTPSGSLTFVRSASLLALSLVAATALPQADSASFRLYKPDVGPAMPWRINEHHTLLWNGTAYLPIGLRIEGTPTAIERAFQAGIRDVIVDLPANGMGWEEAIQTLKAKEMRFLIALSSTSPAAFGTVVEPQVYRIDAIQSSNRWDFKLPGCTDALAVFVLQRDRSVQEVKRVQVVNGVAAIDFTPLSMQDHVLLLYPRMAHMARPDYWEGFDRHRDQLLSLLGRHTPGPGLRGIVNPLGVLSEPSGSRSGFVPSSETFQLEFANYLEGKYRNVETAARAWSLSTSDIDTFPKLARLVPLWIGMRGVDRLWDPTTDRLYPCDFQRSTAWADIERAIAETAVRRTERLINSLRRVADVPMLQEWTGWHTTLEHGTPALNGIGLRIGGTSAKFVAQDAASAASSLLRWKTPGWMLGTEITAADVDGIAPSLDELGSIGMRGAFFRSTAPASLAEIVTQGGQRASDDSQAQYSPRPIFYPERAANPAAPQRLPGGRWWLPSPEAGGRIDLGAGFHAYRYAEGERSFTAIWTTGKPMRVKLFSTEGPALKFESTDDSDPKPKTFRQGVEVMVGNLPLLVTGSEAIPVPEPSYIETMAKFDALLTSGEAAGFDVSQDRFVMRDALSGFDREPGPAFVLMRQLYWSLNVRMAPYVWFEAESARKAVLADPVTDSACSGGGALTLRTQSGVPGPLPGVEFIANFRKPDLHDVWVAAKVPPLARKFLRLTIGAEAFLLDSEPVGSYGSGFGWYRVGSYKPLGASAQARLDMLRAVDGEVAIDAILLTPTRGAPSGPFPPEIVVAAPNAKPIKKG